MTVGLEAAQDVETVALALEEFDTDAAIEEASARVGGASRRDFLRAAVAGGSVVAAIFLSPDSARAAPARDVDILNYALTLEYLQASFYTEAERRGALTGPARRAARVVGSVERAHVRALKKVLGREAVKRPFFNFRGTTEAQVAFLKTAVAFEDLAVAAYKGQAARIQSPAVLAAAVSIHSVEARHAAWMRFLVGETPAGAALDDPKSMSETLDLVASTGFIASTPATGSNADPQFTG